MPTVNLGPLPVASIDSPIIEVLKGNTTDKQVVSSQLNSVLKAQLISAANGAGQDVLANLLQNLAEADLAADENVSLQQFVTEHTTLPKEPTAKQAAQAAIATLSATTTVGMFLGLNNAVSASPALTGLVAQSNLAALLATSPSLANAKLQTDFIQKYLAFDGTAHEFWTQLSADPVFKGLVPELQFTMQLGLLTLNNTQLISALRTTYKPSSLRALTTLDPSAFMQLITSRKIPVPSSIPGSTQAEQQANYVNGIIDLLQKAYPTDYVAKQFASSKDAAQQLVAKVLSNVREIDFLSTNLDPYLKHNSARAFQGIPTNQVASVTEQLEGTQRICRITQEASSVTTLLSAGMDSAAKITSIPRTAFVGRFSTALGGATNALAVYAAAQQINAQSVNVYRTIQSGLNDVNPRAIANPEFDLTAVIQQQVPNWQELFGSTSYCTCDECGSVYGPAAYFVDLLEFLRYSGQNADSISPLDVLIGKSAANPPIVGRRPDLAYIKLDCQNADTPLPYVDLINEILESYIACEKLEAHNTPANATANELSVNPEYTCEKAYSILAQATYPLLLPYDRFLDIARTYLTFLGGNRRGVLELFHTQAAPFDPLGALAAETLGLSDVDFKLISGWDFVSGNTVPPSAATWVSYVPTFLQQAGLSFDELVELLRTQFINSAQTITLSGNDSCDTGQMVINGLTEATLTTIPAFLRLWKKLGVPMSVLGKALRVLAPSGINRTCLLALADSVSLGAQTSLPISQLLGLWSDIDTDGRNSLYLQLFQNKAVLNPVDKNLALCYRATLSAMPAAAPPASVATQLTVDSGNHQLLFTGVMTDEQRADLLTWAAGNAAVALAVENLYEARWTQGTDIGPSATITDETPAILAALRISADDLNAIREATGLLDTTTKTPLTLANLSQLYRYALLAQSLGLVVPDLISLISLTGLNPFGLAPSDPVTQNLVGFVQAVQAVQASRFSAGDLNFIYRAISNPAAGIGPLAASVDVLAITLQAGLAKIAAANSYTPDPTGKLLRQKLGTLVASTELSSVMDLISGAAAYEASLPALPTAVAFPDELAAVISYDNDNHVLVLNGTMTDSQREALTNLSTESDYVHAISTLYQQPLDIISKDLGFLNASEALSKLNNVLVPTPSDHNAYVLQNLLLYLTASQSRSLVVQSLSQALGLDSATITLLIADSSNLSPSALLKSQRDPNQPAIVDFLDLRDGGPAEPHCSQT